MKGKIRISFKVCGSIILAVKASENILHLHQGQHGAITLFFILHNLCIQHIPAQDIKPLINR